MKHSLAHRFQAALAIAFSHSPPQVVRHWVPLATTAAMPRAAQLGPMQLTLALLPLCLLHWDNQAALLLQLESLNIAPSSPGPGLGSASGAIAREGVLVMRQLMAAILREQPLGQISLSPAVGPEFPHLSPYLSTALTPTYGNGGLLQRQAALSPLAGQYSQAADHAAAAALTLTLHNAVRHLDQGQLACDSLCHGLPQPLSQAAMAIAGALCGLFQGLGALTLSQYQLLKTAQLPTSPEISNPEASNPRAPENSAPALLLGDFGQQLVARWAGALPPRLGVVAIAPANILRSQGHTPF